MEKIINNTELIRIFERQTISDNIKSILNDFDSNYNKVTYKKGIYIYVTGTTIDSNWCVFFVMAVYFQN